MHPDCFDQISTVHGRNRVAGETKNPELGMKGNRLQLDSESGKIKCRSLRKRTGAFFNVIYFWNKKNVIIIIKIKIGSTLSFFNRKKNRIIIVNQAKTKTKIFVTWNKC